MPTLPKLPLFFSLFLSVAGSAAIHAQTIAPSPGAGYVQRDGAIRIVGTDDLSGVIGRLNELFVQSHPGLKFNYVKANNLAALQTLVFDASAFAPVGSEFLIGAQVPYRAIVHAEPYGIRVAHGSLNPAAEVSPLAIVVNKSNPLEQLTTDQVTHIFTEGGRKRDLSHWGQLGEKGDWASREIHPCGLPWSDHYRSEDPTFPEYMFLRKLGGSAPAWNYAMLPTSAQIVRKVSEDPSAIGIIGLNRVTRDLKVVAVSTGEWAEPARGSAAEIVSGQYAYDRFIYIFVRREPGKPIDPLVREYLRLVLSPAGQQAIGAESKGYLPLNSMEITEELQKL